LGQDGREHGRVDDRTELGYEILKSIRRILRKVSEHSRTLAQSTGLTVPQLLCLRAIQNLGVEGDVTVVAVADRVRLASATVSRILDRLERAGFVVRERMSQDRRKVAVRLTPLGVERLRDLPQPLHEQFIRRVEALPTAELEVLLASLDRVVAMMEADKLDAAPMLTPDVDMQHPPPGV